MAVPYLADSACQTEVCQTEACQTEACQTEACQKETVTVEQSISDESYVILALGLSQEDSECVDSDFYSDPEFD